MSVTLLSHSILFCLLLRENFVYSAVLIRQPVGNISIQYCQILKKVIPLNAYYDDVRNSNALELQLLDQNRKPVPSNAKYVQLNAADRTLYIVPVYVASSASDPTSTGEKILLNYILRAINPSQVYEDDYFSVEISGNVLSRKYGVVFKTELLKPNLSDMENLYHFINTLYLFLYPPAGGSAQNQNQIQIYWYTKFDGTGGSQTSMELSYQNCTARDVCDLLAIRNIKSLYGLFNVTYAVPARLDALMKSYSFNLQSIDVRLIDPCKETFQPQINPEVLTQGNPSFEPVLYQLITSGVYIGQYPGMFEYAYPNNTFVMPESYDEIRIELYVEFGNKQKLPILKTHWAYITREGSATFQYTLYVVMIDAAYQSNTDKVLYDVTALTPVNSGAILGTILNIDQAPLSYYVVTFTFTNFVLQSSSIMVLSMRFFLNSLITVFGESYRSWIFLKSFSFSSTGSTSGVAVWGLKVNPNCNFSLIVATQRIMFVSENTKTTSSTFQENLRFAFTLNQIQETFSGPCALEPPTKVNAIPPLNFGYCGIYTYIIPANTFYDNQEGGTRNLTLKLLNSDNTPLGTSSWIQFNTKDQTITAILPTEAQSSITPSNIFKLVATDSTNQATECDVVVNIIGTPKGITYRVTVRGIYSSNQQTNPAQVISTKVTNWFKDSDKFQLISQGVTSNNEQYASFTNCSWRTNPCDALKVDAYKKSIFPDGNTASNAFVSIFSPEFQNVVVTQTLSGSCANNKPPEVVTGWGPLSLSSCSLFKQQVPENTFYDTEQGNTRNLQCSLTGSNTAATMPSWVRFDTQRQELTMLAYSNLTIASTVYLFSLTAQDIEGKATSQSLITNLATYSEEPSHTVEMTLRVTSNSLNNFIDIYENLREKIKFYFGDTENTVEYIFLTQYPSTTYTVHWTNCTVSRSICEQAKLDFIENRVLSNGQTSPSFINALTNDFALVKATFVTSGVCKKAKEDPKVLNEIPRQYISYCGYLRYRIPENTFLDGIDGGTRSLALTLTNQDGSVIPNDNWLVFDETQQTVSAILQSSKPLTQQTYVFNLTATTKRGRSVSTLMTVNITGKPSEEKTYFRFVVQTKALTTTKASELYIALFDKIHIVYASPVTDITLNSGNYAAGHVIAEVMNCDIECSKQTIQTLESVLSLYDTTKFQPEFETPTVSVRVGRSCLAKPPVLIQPPNPFTVNRCAQFSVGISNEIFTDNNGAENLNYVITEVNGNTVHDWISTDGMKIVGIITNEVLKARPENSKYNLTLRAVNQYNLWAETWVMMTVSGDLPQLFYKYDMTIEDKLTLTSTLNTDLARQIAITKQLNGFFQNKVINIVSYSKQTGNNFAIQWSVCPLPNRCTTTGASSYSSLIFASNQPSQTFKNAFDPNFALNTITQNNFPDCDTINPPRETRNPLTINTVYCGGLDYLIPADLFTDQEDGGTRQLTLIFEVTRGQDVSSSYPWLSYDQTSQRLQGMPTYAEAKELNVANSKFLLTARDSSGQETTISAYIKFTLPQEPKYSFVFIMSSFQTSDVTLRFTYMNKVASFLGDSSRVNVGFTSIKSTQIDYFNCSIPYSPCDLYQLKTIKSLYSDESGIPRTQLRNAMQPEFNVASVTGNKQSPCGGPNRPNVNATPPVVVITMCGYHAYQIPVYTFYDLEDGNTRNLALSVAVKSSATFSMSNYVQFVSSTQTVNIVPKAQLLATYGRDYLFSLKATDTSGLSVNTDLMFKIQGPYSLLTECQIQVTLQQLATSQSSRTSVEAMTFVIQRLMSYFEIQQNEIGVVDFYTKSSNQFFFSWSYCSSMYQQESYQSNSATLSVDYVGLQTKIMQKLYHQDRKTIHANFMSAFQSDYSVISVVPVFTARCKNLPPVVDPGTEISITIGFGGYAFHFYRNSYFYDFEDGWAYDLYLTMLSSTYQTLLIDSWINVDVTSRNIYAVVMDTVRFSSTSSYIFYLQATDTQGLYARIKVTVTKDGTFYGFAPFSITYLLQYNGQAGLVYANQSSHIINTITRYFTSISQSKFVLVRWYYKTIGYGHYREITWTVADHTCQSTVLSTIRRIYNQNGGLDSTLVQSLSGMFTLRRLYYQTTCDPQPPTPPSPPTVLPAFNITYCSVFTYQLSVSLFYDDLDGEADKLKLGLLDSRGNAVSRSSWFQLNTVTMQLYAVAIKSAMQVQSSYSYKIQATNSGKKSNTIDLTAVIRDEPFTSDCKITMQFAYKYETSTLVDLDIIRKFISMVTEYYQDKTTMVKVLSFTGLGNGSYRIVWSNCSFKFETKQQASYGLTEADRSALTYIYSQMVSRSNQIVSKFQTFMSSYFQITSIQPSYDCIEEPPIPLKKSLKVYGRFCELFIDNISPNLFEDKQDGNTRNLKLTLTNLNGRALPINNWVQIDSQQNVYGVVTETVKSNAVSSEYNYLIVATDSSGRSANVTYTIVVASARRHYDVYFQTGFTSRFGYLDSTAFMLYNIVEKLSKYIDPTDKLGKIYVKEFHYPSTLLWTHCSLQPCKKTDVTNIRKKLTTDAGVITTDFVQAMEPQVTPVTTRLNIEKTCGDSNTTVIPNPPPPNETIPNCGYFTYQIPNNLFTDIFGRGTYYFLLNFFYTTGQSIPTSSWIRFNQTFQYVYAIPILSQLSQSSYFTLQAVHPGSGNTVSVQTTFTIRDFNEISKVSSKLCYITFHLTVKYNPGLDDVSTLKLFMQMLAGYLNANYNTIQIFSYSRGGGYPYNMVITWTNCTLTALFQRENFAQTYYSQFSQIINSMIIFSNGQYSMKQQIIDYFNGNSLFEVTQIVINKNCSEPENPPPVPNPKKLVFTASCGINTFPIPSDTFVPSASQLSLTLLTMENQPLPKNTWVILDTFTREIKCLFNNATIFAASEYKFKLVAEDSAQQRGETTVTIIMPEPFVPVVVEVLLAASYSVDYPYDLIPQLQIVTAMNEYLTTTQRVSNVSFYVTEYIPLNALFTNLKITNCLACRQKLELVVGELTLAHNFNVLKEMLAPEITAYPPLINTINPCSVVHGPLKLIKENLTYCDHWVIDLRERETNLILQYTVQLNDVNDNPLPSDSWIWLYNYTIEGYPPESFWSSSQTSWNFVYTIKNGTQIISRPTNMTIVLIPGKKPDNLIEFKMRLSQPGPRQERMDNFYISKVMNALKDLVGTGVGLHFVSFQILQDNPFTFEVRWQNCSLPTSCGTTEIDEVNKILYGTGSVAGYPIQKYFPGYTIKELDNKCENKPPKPKSSLNLTIPVCGLYKYKLEKDVATDDGKNIDALTITLLQSDGTALPRNSWIRYNASGQELYGFPTEAILAGSRQYAFRLSFQDTEGGIATMPVYVTVNDSKEVYYEMSISFLSQMPASTAYLDMQIKMLELISTFTKGRIALEEYRISVFSVTDNGLDNVYYMKYGDCSIRKKICKNEEEAIEEIESKLKTSSDQLTASFSRYIQRYFTGRSMSRVTSTVQVDQSPIVLDNINIIVLSCCQVTCVNIKNNFYDAEQTNLIYKLKSNGKDISLKYWTQIVNDQICVYPWSNLTVGKYEFSLEAMDNCGSTVTIPVTVDLTCVHKGPFGYKWTVVNNDVTSNTSYPDVYYVSQVRTRMVNYLKQMLGPTYEENNVQVLSYELKKNDNRFTFAECGIVYKPCNQSAVSRIVNALFIDNKVPNSELKKIFSDVMPVSTVEGTRQYPCGDTPGGPTCTVEKLVINATRCSELSYLLPDVCRDEEDGAMKNLRLKLLTPSLTPLPLSSWLQFNQTSRRIYGYPLYDNTNSTVRYDLTLEVQDSDGNKTIISICVYLNGKTTTADYQLTLIGELNEASAAPFVDHRICITNRLSVFFDNLGINNVAFDRGSVNQRRIRFNWSFCEQRDSPCDCMMVKKTQDLLKDMDRFKNTMRECVRVSGEVTYKLYGDCAKTNKPTLENGISEVTVNVGQVYETVLPNNQFSDAEDGTNRNLTIIVRDVNNNELTDIDWMTVYDNKICGLMDYYDYTEKGYTKNTKIDYLVVAIDMCGKESYDKFTVNFVNNFPDLSYRVHIRLNYPYSSFQGNCSKIDELLQTIADYAEVPKSDILVQQLSAYNDSVNGTVNATYFVWGVRKFTGEDCDHEEFETFREKFIKDDQDNEVFKEVMRNNDMEVEDIWDYFDSQCTTWPWWILILILALLLLLLLLWCLWCCIPRCCPTCCGRFCPGCLPCCSKGGTCSSMGAEKDDKLISPEPSLLPEPVPEPEVEGSPSPEPTPSSPGGGSTRFTGSKEIDTHSHSSGIESMGSHSNHSGGRLPIAPLPPVYPPPGVINKGSGGGSSGDGSSGGGGKSNRYGTDDHVDGGGRDNTDHHFHTESWSDKRIPDVYERYEHGRRRSLNDDYYNRHSRLNDNYHYDDGRNVTYTNSGSNYANENVRYIKGSDNYGYSGYTHGDQPYYGEYYSYDSRPRRDISRQQYHHDNRYKSGIRRVQHDGYKAGKRVRVKQPVAVRVRRSELNDYVKTQGRDGKIVLNSKDIERLMHRNPKLSIRGVGGDYHNRERRVIRSDSRLSDALIDRQLIRTDYGSNGGRSRSYSSSSLSDLIAVNDNGKDVVITPRNVTFKLDDRVRTYNDGGYSSGSSYDSGRYVVRHVDDRDRSGSGRRYYMRDTSTTGDSASEFAVIPHNRHYNASREYAVTNRRSGGVRKVYELKSTGRTRNTYVNRGYDDSSV